jgi:hypothetical protein
LTTPYLRLPLIVEFFATKDRVNLLLESEIQWLVESVMFEPRRWQSSRASYVQLFLSLSDCLVVILFSACCANRTLISKIPAVDAQLGCSSGILLNELISSPAVLLDALIKVFFNVFCVLCLLRFA